MEAQQAAHCKNLLLQHQQEKEEMLQKHLQVREMTELPDLEKEQREEREREILTHYKQQQLKLQDFMSEQQPQLCKPFALRRS